MTTMQVFSHFMYASSFNPLLQAKAGEVTTKQPASVFGIDPAGVKNRVLVLADAPQPSRSLGENTFLLMMQ